MPADKSLFEASCQPQTEVVETAFPITSEFSNVRFDYYRGSWNESPDTFPIGFFSRIMFPVSKPWIDSPG